MLKEFVKSPFMVLFFLCAITGIWPLVMVPKGGMVLWLNDGHNSFADIFFKYWTVFGNGLFLGLLLVFFLFYRYYYALITVVSIVIQSVLITVFKRWLFAGLERPLAFFGDQAGLHLVEGVKVHLVNTFPSGHTTTAFSVFALAALAFGMRRPWLSALFFVMAFLVGVSRIYLVQHFFADVYAGAWLGTLSVLAGIMVVRYWWVKDTPENYRKSLLRKA